MTYSHIIYIIYITYITFIVRFSLYLIVFNSSIANILGFVSGDVFPNGKSTIYLGKLKGIFLSGSLSKSKPFLLTTKLPRVWQVLRQGRRQRREQSVHCASP